MPRPEARHDPGDENLVIGVPPELPVVDLGVRHDHPPEVTGPVGTSDHHEHTLSAGAVHRTLTLAVLRGALLDLLATGDEPRLTEAVTHHLSLLRAHGSAS
ncbi:hypothetical protein GCM10009828_081860 [Actinoplanes couchii]|uniref:Uncharacterized protein n=1 Tax=Actinoplanes couchii TaxID=403638 RepID=A0ABQ3XL01_9ACTN|nr:hypothetical protein Aco03nite_075890 [Actinoplanes couchii]